MLLQRSSHWKSLHSPCSATVPRRQDGVCCWSTPIMTLVLVPRPRRRPRSMLVYVQGYKEKNTQKNPPLLKCYSCNGFLTMRHLAHSRLVISVLHSFLLMIVVFFVLWRWQVESTVRVLFKHVSYTELKSVIWNKLWCSLLCSKGQSFFQKKRRKKKTWKPNVVFSEFLIMYSFGDLKFVSLYF